MIVSRIVGIILVVYGALIVLGSSLVDILLRVAPDFGIRQIGGVLVGAINVILGLILLLAKKSR